MIVARIGRMPYSKLVEDHAFTPCVALTSEKPDSMSTGEIIASLAANFIVAGVVWYLRGTNSGLVCLGLGLLLLIVAYLFRKKTHSQPSPPPTVQKNKQTVTQEANPHIYIGADLLQRTIERNVPTPSQPPKPQPNIRFVETKSVKSHIAMPGGNILYESPQGLGDFYVSVVCFRNEAIPGQSVQEPRIKTHIIYKDHSGNEITDAPRGVWLGLYGESTVFESGQKKCIIVFLLSNQDTLKKLGNETYTTRNSWMAGGPQFRISDEGILQEVGSVEISLLAHNSCLLRATFDVKPRDSGKLPMLTMSSVSAG
jgi:hypothetical protein